MRLRRYIGGAMVQASITAATATQAFLAPRLLGAGEYGRAISALALPFLVHAGIETVLYTLTIKWANDRNLGSLTRLWFDAAICAVFIGGGAGLLSLTSLASHSSVERLVFVAGTPFVLLLWIGATILMSSAYALHEHGVLVRTYLLSAVVLPVSVLVCREWGALGFFLGLLVDKVVALASLLLNPNVRRFSTGASLATPLAWRRRRLVEVYFPVLVPRLTFLLLSPGLLVLGSASLSSAELAGFKVTLSFAAAATSLVPVSQPVLQAQWTGTKDGRGDHTGRREVLFLLLFVLLLGCVFAAALLFFGDFFRTIVLGAAVPSLRKFDIVFGAVPLFVLIGPLSSFLVAHDRVRTLTSAFWASVVAVGIAMPLGGVSWAFDAGTAAFVAFALRPLLPTRSADA